MKKLLAIAVCTAALATPAHAEMSLACWSSKSFKRLDVAYRTGGFMAAWSVYNQLTDCWAPNSQDWRAPGVIVARRGNIKDRSGNGSTAVLMRKRYTQAPYRGHYFYLAYSR